MPPRAKRGRPPEAEPGHIAKVALRLFERRGFERVTMDEVAEAASVSRRTLFRLFPSKLDLVWDGVKGVHGAVKLRAAGIPSGGAPLSAIVEELVMPLLRQLDEPGEAMLARRRLRLIARAPALLNHPALQDIEQVIAAKVSPRALGAAVPGSLAARALVATLFGALLWWAEHGEDMGLVEVARAALQAVTLALEGA